MPYILHIAYYNIPQNTITYNLLPYQDKDNRRCIPQMAKAQVLQPKPFLIEDRLLKLVACGPAADLGTDVGFRV